MGKKSGSVKKIVFICMGFVALILGGIGIAVPVFPTTPFVLVAAGCFSASSPKLYKWLENTRYFGEYVRNYKSKTGICNKARFTGIAFLWVTLSISAFIFRQPHVWIILAVVGLAVTIHIMTIKKKITFNKIVSPEENDITGSGQ